MSTAKHEQLIAAGQLNEDGTHKKSAGPTGDGHATGEAAVVIAEQHSQED